MYSSDYDLITLLYFLPQIRYTEKHLIIKISSALSGSFYKEDFTMFRLWGKEFKDNRMIKDTTICDDSDDTRTHKIFNALDEICYEFDLSKPIWLDVNINEFKRHSKARFYQDSFVDSIDFDFLEIQVIEE